VHHARVIHHHWIFLRCSWPNGKFDIAPRTGDSSIDLPKQAGTAIEGEAPHERAVHGDDLGNDAAIFGRADLSDGQARVAVAIEQMTPALGTDSVRNVRRPSIQDAD